MFIFKNGKKHTYEAWKKQCILDAEDMTKEERNTKLTQLRTQYEKDGRRAMELMWEVIKETDVQKKQKLNDEFHELGDLFMFTSYFIQAIAEVNRTEAAAEAAALANIKTGDLPL